MPSAQYRLVIRQGPVTGQIYELNQDEVTIGRDISNNFVINDAEVSRKHARLTRVGDRYRIEDLNSTNGTYIDGQRLIGPHLMSIGEIIMFGDNVGVIFDGEPASPDATVASRVQLGNTPVAAIPAPQEEYIRRSAPAEEYIRRPVPDEPEVTIYPMPDESVTEYEPEEFPERVKKPVNSWLLAGCGCFVVILLLIIAVLIFIDQPWNPGGGLYCYPPFNLIFSAFGYCP